VTRGTSRLRVVALVVLVVATVGCDRITKHLAVTALSDSPGRSFMHDTVRLQYSENTGGFLSLGATWPAPVRTTVFTLGNAVLLGLMVFMAVRDRWSGLSALGAALFAAGGISNVADRVVRGSVVDFLNVGIGGVRTGIFNVADVAIMAGVLLFGIEMLRRRPPGRLD
jgi:signal peptidase II